MAENWLPADLRGFLVLAEELHFGRAAERLGVAQPVLSRRIRRLEAAVGAALFDRTSRTVALTVGGTRLRDQAGPALRLLEGAMRGAARDDPGNTAPLRVGFLSAAQSLLPAVLERWRTILRRPVRLVRATSAQQLEMLRTDRIEIAFLRPPATAGSLALTTVRQEGMVCALPVAHPLAGRDTLRLADLAGQCWVRHGAVLGTSFQQRMEERLRRDRIALEHGPEADDTPSVMMLVAAGYGLALLPESVRLFAPPGTRCLAVTDIRPFVRLAIAHRRHDVDPQTARAVRIAVDTARGGG